MEVDFSRLDFATATKVDEVLRRDYNALIVRAAKEQAQAAAIRHLHRPLSRDGFGEQTLAIHPVFDAFWRQAYGESYAQADPDLIKFLVKRNPEIAVRARGTKEIFVGYMPSSNSRKPVGLTPAEKGFN